MKQHSIGKEAAIALYESKWWETKTPREIAEFQLCVSELSVPFEVFHEAVTKALDRGVWTHEFIHPDVLYAELCGERPAPTLEEIFALIPEGKRVVIQVVK